MRTPKQRHSHEEWEKTVEDVDLQIAQLAIMCHVRLLDPGVIERVLDNDLRICGDGHESGFEKLRGMLYLHYEVQTRLAEELGPVAPLSDGKFAPTARPGTNAVAAPMNRRRASRGGAMAVATQLHVSSNQCLRIASCRINDRESADALAP